MDDKMELEVCFNGELALKESHYGVMFNTRISLIEHGMCSSVIRVRLNPQPPHDPEVIYELGIDDLWEERLYAIADALLEYSGGQIERLTIPDPSEHPFHKH